MDLNLKDKVALVTGGSRGLGRAICLSLAAEGAHVAVNYHRYPEMAKNIIEEIESSYGSKAVAVPGDVGHEDNVRDIFNLVEKRLSPVEILVNNAAICPTRMVKDMEIDEWNQTLQVNLTGTFLVCREMVKRLTSAGQTGRIVNIVSQAAFRGSTTGHSPYDASKGGMVSFTVSLAREVALQGIAVNAVAPGMILTDMVAEVIKKDEAKYLNRIPLHRIARPEEIASVVCFLASNRSSYMTGATVDVSGGMLMR